MEDIREKLKELIIHSLRLKSVDSNEFTYDKPLIDGEIRIDSIDILQLIVDIEKKFGIKLVKGKFDRTIWTNISTLAAAIEAEKNAGKT